MIITTDQQAKDIYCITVSKSTTCNVFHSLSV